MISSSSHDRTVSNVGLRAWGTSWTRAADEERRKAEDLRKLAKPEGVVESVDECVDVDGDEDEDEDEDEDVFGGGDCCRADFVVVDDMANRSNTANAEEDEQGLGCLNEK